MESTQDYADRIGALYDRDAPAPPPGVEVPGVFGYIHFKAFGFLIAGPDEYRRHDALGQPPEGTPAATLDAIRLGCEQIVRRPQRAEKRNGR